MNRSKGAVLVASAMLILTACQSSDDRAQRVPDAQPEPTTSIGDARGTSACANNDTSYDTAGDRTMVMEIDWVDFVRLNGIDYYSGLGGEVPPVAAEKLGRVLGRVECEYSVLKFSEMPGTPAADGDAAFLDVGTEVHAVPGFDPACRVAAEHDGAIHVYLAQQEGARFARAVSCAKAP